MEIIEKLYLFTAEITESAEMTEKNQKVFKLIFSSYAKEVVQQKSDEKAPFGCKSIVSYG